MRTVVTFLLAFAMILGVNAQEQEKLSKSELRKLQREQKKAEMAAEREKMAVLTEFMITNQRFVLEAEYLSDKYGSRVPVQSNINFVMVDSLVATIQLGSAMSAGYNGVGGTTVEGKVSNYKYTKIGRKEDSYSVSMNFMSSFGNYDITMMVNAGGNTDATIRGSWPGALNYHGRLVPLSESRVYKAMPIY